MKCFLSTTIFTSKNILEIIFFHELLPTAVLAIPVSPLIDISLGLLSTTFCQLGTDNIGLIPDASSEAHLLFGNSCSVTNTQSLVATGPRHHHSEQWFYLGGLSVPPQGNML